MRRHPKEWKKLIWEKVFHALLANPLFGIRVVFSLLSRANFNEYWRGNCIQAMAWTEIVCALLLHPHYKRITKMQYLDGPAAQLASDYIGRSRNPVVTISHSTYWKFTIMYFCCSSIYENGIMVSHTPPHKGVWIDVNFRLVFSFNECSVFVSANALILWHWACVCANRKTALKFHI